MDTFFKAVQGIITCKDSSSEKIQEVCRTFGLSQEAVYYRIRTLFGDKLRNLRWKYFEPTREELLKAVSVSENSKQVRGLFSYIPARQWTGVYDRVLNVSTFTKAKEMSLDSFKITKYAPSTTDNKALIAACIIGDGYFDPMRFSIKIEHGAKQGAWLKKKVEMLHSAFPYFSSVVKETKRGTYSWYSGKIQSIKFKDICSKPREELVQYLNPLGIWLLFLDDGCYCKTTQQSVSIGFDKPETGKALQQKLLEYGFNFRIQGKHALVLTSGYNVKRFILEMLAPFEHLTPECMKYKITYEDIVHTGSNSQT